MARGERVVRNLYRDSVSLMQLSATLGRMPGVQQASAVMATVGNLELLREAGLIAAAIEPSPNDLLVAVEAADEATLAEALATAEAELSRAPAAQDGAGPRRVPPKSLEMALSELPTANLALISTPGDYAAAEAMKALRLGLNVMLFSDNVALADEIELKTLRPRARPPGDGTGLRHRDPLRHPARLRQRGAPRRHRRGRGLRHWAPAGDLPDRSLGPGHLAGDRHRRPRPQRRGRRHHHAAGPARAGGGSRDPGRGADLEAAASGGGGAGSGAASAAGKPIVVNFLGADPSTVRRPNVHPVRTLEDAARLAVALAGNADAATGAARSEAAVEDPRLAPGQRYVRGLYSGGTFCYEALLLLSEVLGPVRSNTPLDPDCRLDDVWQSQGHTAIDLGDDVFTRGRPHPMIDQTLRCERLRKEAADPEVAVVLFDVVLGYGAHPDPAAELVPAVRSARARPRLAGARSPSSARSAAPPRTRRISPARRRRSGTRA